MDQSFHLSKNKSSKFTLLKHAYSTRNKSNKHAKMSANKLFMGSNALAYLSVMKKKVL